MLDTAPLKLDVDDPAYRFVRKSMLVGEQIIQLLERRKMKPKALMAKLGIDQETYDAYMGGVHDFTLREIAAIEAVFRTDLLVPKVF